MTDKQHIDWTRVLEIRSYLSRVAYATGLDPENVNKFVAEEVARLKEINPKAADVLCEAELDEVDNAQLQEAWRELAWMWLAGQSLIEQANN